MSDPRAEAAVRADTRRRVLAAFVSQGRSEEAPAGARIRPLVVGVVAAVLLLAGGVASGRLAPASPGVWSDGDVVVGRSSAARLVSIGGVLHPLLNAASGRLLRPASSTGRVTVLDDTAIAQVRRGSPLGIPGAPDVLPAPTALVQTGWLACLDGTGIRTRIAPAAVITSAPAAITASSTGERGVMVTVAGQPDGIYLVAADRRYRIPTASYPAVKQYLDQTRAPQSAPPRWVELFPAGTDLTFGSFRFGAPAMVGQQLPDALGLRGTAPRMGQLVTNTDRAGAVLVVVADGTVPLTAFAAAIYRATAPADLATPLAVTDVDLARLPPSATTDFTPADWPTTPPLAASIAAPGAAAGSGSTDPPPAGSVAGSVAGSAAGSVAGSAAGSATGATSTTGALTPCAELDTAAGRPPTTHLRLTVAVPASGVGPSSPSPSPTTTTAPVVGPGGGAVVSVVTGPNDGTTAYLVDPSGRAFPVGSPSGDTLARLGYTGVVPPVVPAAWIALCPTGPQLSAAAAQLPTEGAAPS